MTREHAQTLVDTFYVNVTLNDPEEVQLLREGNPGLLAAYEALRDAALKSVEAGQQRPTPGSPKLPPCGSCGARGYCLTNAKPDSTQCYDAWRQLRAGA
jgi:hypothetical protein